MECDGTYASRSESANTRFNLQEELLGLVTRCMLPTQLTHGPKDDSFMKSYIRHEDFRSSCSSVTLRVPPLISEMGWTGELWSKTKFLILENY